MRRLLRSLSTRRELFRRVFRVLPALFFVLVFGATIARAQDKPRTLLVLVSGANVEDLQQTGRLSELRKAADRGGIALMHNGVWGQFTESAAYLSVGASERMAAPEGAPTIEELRRFQPPVANRAEKVSALGDALARGHVRVGDSDNIGLASLVTSQSRNTTEGPTDFACLVPDGIGTLNEFVRTELPQLEKEKVTIYIAAPYPPAITGGKPYRRLGFLIAIGPGIPAGSLLTSPTTRTIGLVANVDIAPTIAARYGQAIPGAAGQPVEVKPAGANRWKQLSNLDRETTAAARATVPVLLGYGIYAAVSLVFALVALWIARPAILRAARFGMLVAASTLLALLPLGIIAPQMPLAYGAIMAGIAIALAVLAYVLAKPLRQEPLRLVFLGLVIVVSIDGLFGAPLVARAVLSGFYLSGIRFYGIGNEFQGLTTGAAVAALSPWWLCVPVVGAIGLPYFGADAGGTLGSTVAFAVMWLGMRTQRFRWRHIVIAFSMAFGMTVAFALLDRLQPASARSHVGAAVATGESHGGIAALAEIAIRKISMNLRLAMTPWTFAAVAALVPIWLLLSRGTIGKRLGAALEKRPGLRYAVIPGSLWGALATAVFNDSGIVAALLMLLPLTVSLLDALLADAIEQAGT